jgi:phosphomannomutase / phosphoglucomutase
VKANIFREYDIRGIVGEEFDLESAYDLAKAITTYMHQQHPEKRAFIIGRDGRTHSEIIQNHMTQAVLDLGFDVIDIGICPTPVLYFAVQHLSLPTAFVITASHNPQEYNGVKMWDLHGHHIQAIKNIYNEKKFVTPLAQTGSKRFYDVITPYVNYMVQHFEHLKNKALHAVIDCGNGTAGTVLPLLIEKMNWSDVQLLFQAVDGTFPYHEADPTVLKNMSYVAASLDADTTLHIGIGLDGDCDRMNPMSQTKKLVAGDTLLALFAQQVLKKNPGVPIVCDIKSSNSLLEALKMWGAQIHMAPSGHSLIKKTIKEKNALLGGELSCHFFFKDRYFGYDDGIYAMLRTFELIHETNKTLDQLIETIPSKISSPEIRISCTSDDDKIKIVQHAQKVFGARKDVECLTVDGMRVHFKGSWGLIRASNTQPAISLRFEADTIEGLQQVKHDFYKLLTLYFDEKMLREKIDI